MDLIEAIEQRHSVRRYSSKPIPAELLETIGKQIERYNIECNLHMQLICNEPAAFNSLKAKYGKFKNVNTYIALIGKKARDLDERCGYYGEKLVLLAQQLGLNSCWVGGTYKKVPDAYSVLSGEKIVCVISIGYGEHAGLPRRSKSYGDVVQTDGTEPDWFRAGVMAALKAPTAINQQRFCLTWKDGKVTAAAKRGPFSKVDLGIVKCHFEIGCGGEYEFPKGKIMGLLRSK